MAERDGQVVGFVNSGSTNKDDLSDETLKDLIGHQPEGKNIVIFSLAVLPPFQRQGIARTLMHRFIETAKRLKKDNILLICQAALLPYYRQYGFIHRGESSSTHGGLHWQEMCLPLNRTKNSDPPVLDL